MRRNILILICLLCHLFLFSQRKIQPFINLQNDLSYDALNGDIFYIDGCLDVGIMHSFPKSSISIFGDYHISANTSYILSDNKMYFHLMGGGVEYSFKSLKNLNNFSISGSVLTEIDPHYKGKYITGIPYNDSLGYSFWLTPQKSSTPPKYYGDVPQLNYTYYYISTPLVIKIMPNYRMSVTSNFFINIGLGLSARAYKIGYKQWGLNEPEPPTEMSRIHSFHLDLNKREMIKWGYLLDFRFGLQYLF